jgi:hypothetical protein
LKNRRKTNYAQKNSLSGLIVILPGESHKVALSRQEPRVQENHTPKLRDPLDHAIKWENWATAKEIFDQILDVDPLHRRSPSPLPKLQEGDTEEPDPKRPRIAYF